MAAHLLDWRTERALRDPSWREALDILPDLIIQRSPLAQRALLAIAADAHRGWLDTLLELEAVAVDQGIVGPWTYALEACLGQEGPMMSDGDITRALQRAAIHLGAQEEMAS